MVLYIRAQLNFFSAKYFLTRSQENALVTAAFGMQESKLMSTYSGDFLCIVITKETLVLYHHNT